MHRGHRIGVALALCLGLTGTLRADDPPYADTLPTLNPRHLGAVLDDKPFGNWEHAVPDEIPPEAQGEDAVYWQALENAVNVPPAVFARAAEQNRHLTFGHLYGEPSKYRGQVVHVEGRLVRLKRLDPPHHAQLRGIRVLYEAWVYLDQPGTHPVCIVMPHQPDGIDVGDNLNKRVTSDGYFFKRYRYTSGRLDAAGNNIQLNTVLLVAPTATLMVRGVSAPRTALSSVTWWPWLGGFAAGVAALMIAMTWWFRRNDRQVMARLQTARDICFVEHAHARPVDPS